MPTSTTNHSWTYAEKVELFKIVVNHVGKYERDNWKLRNATAPIDYSYNEALQVLKEIRDDLVILYDNEEFKVHGCGFIIRQVISFQDNLDTPKNLKDDSRMAALEAGFISDDDFDYIELMDDPDNKINFEIVNGKLTPEQLLEHFDNPLAKNVLKNEYQKYNRGVAWMAILSLYNLKNNDIPKYLKEEAKEKMNEINNAYNQFSIAKEIIDGYIIKNITKAG